MTPAAALTRRPPTSQSNAETPAEAKGPHPGTLQQLAKETTDHDTPDLSKLP